MPSDVYDIVVSVLNIEGTQRGDEYDFCCPVHDDRHPSAGINLTSGLWHCLACGAGGDLTSLAAAVKGIARSEAHRLVQPRTPQALIARLQRAAHVCLSRAPARKLTVPSGYPREPLEYLRQRGLTDETLHTFGAGYVAEETFTRADGSTYRIRDYVALPIRDERGGTLGYVYRAAGQSVIPRYFYTPGLELRSLWFGIDLHPRDGIVVVTEGPLDAMWVHQCGFPTLSMLGAAGDPKVKVHHLLRYDDVILFLDRDAAGVHALERWGEALRYRVPVHVARYPRGTTAKDPADLPEELVARAVSKAIPYATWMDRKKRREHGAR